MKQTQTTKRKMLSGTVVSTNMKDTVVVAVVHTVRHPLYKKAVKRTKKFLCHSAGMTVKKGDTVTISEIKPMSKNKHFILINGK